jgi:pyrroloquinoline quinone (PQQ) biosynthesis protein C
MMHPVTEWAEVAGDTLIIARDAGEVWFYPSSGLEEKAVPFATPMTCKGSLHSTVGLLDGAIRLAFERTDDQPAKADPSLVRYIYSLIGAYYTSKDTPRNLLRAARRFEQIGRLEVSRYLEMRAQEEAGHERLALKDLSALGLPAKRIVANCKPASIKPLCVLFDDYCAQDYPMEAIGFSYCSERIAAVKPKAEIDAVKSLFPDSIDATRFLRSHSSLGSEVSHVEETIEFVSELPASDRIRVVRATYKSGVVTAERRRLESIKSEAEICEELEEAAGQELHLFEPRLVGSH